MPTLRTNNQASTLAAAIRRAVHPGYQQRTGELADKLSSSFEQSFNQSARVVGPVSVLCSSRRVHGMHKSSVATIKRTGTTKRKSRSGKRNPKVVFRQRELPASKQPIGISVLQAARERIRHAFDACERLYVSFSGGKDSTVLLHLVADESRARNRKFGVLLIDLEAQYSMTIEHCESMQAIYADCTEWFWVCLPMALRNAVSVYQPQWKCWDGSVKESWVRNPPKCAIVDTALFPFFTDGMEFEEFVPAFGEWYSDGKQTACFVGIRSDESLNRFRTINSASKIRLDGKCYTTKVTPSVFNWYPIYDWATEDVWTYHANNPSKPHNPVYDLMRKAGLSIHQMRLCQPYGDDQRRGLWLYQILEPKTWPKVVARVNGANTGAMYVQETGNMSGYGNITLPPGHTWRSFAELLIDSMPQQTADHFRAKIDVFRKWYMDRGYTDGIPDEADKALESARKVPSWRRVCKALLRNDYWCKTLGFSQHRSGSYDRYLKMMDARRKKAEWELNARENGGQKVMF